MFSTRINVMGVSKYMYSVSDTIFQYLNILLFDKSILNKSIFAIRRYFPKVPITINTKVAFQCYNVSNIYLTTHTNEPTPNDINVRPK